MRPLRPLAHALEPACVFVIGLTVFIVAACSAGVHAQMTSPRPAIDGNPQHGAKLIRHYGCGSCHHIPGISGAIGLVGPPLDNIGSRIYIAGVLRNTPDNMITWLTSPQKVVPSNAMPDMGLSQKQARDIAAYLYTLR